MLEAAALGEDLRRAGIEPYGWVINNSLAAAGTTDPLLAQRAAEEVVQIEKVVGQLATRVYLVPRLEVEPVGPEGLGLMIGHAAVGAHRSA